MTWIPHWTQAGWAGGKLKHGASRLGSAVRRSVSKRLSRRGKRLQTEQQMEELRQKYPPKPSKKRAA